MAASSWAQLAFDSNGVRCDGSISTEYARVEIYKNRLFVYDDRMWFEGGKYVKPTIADVWAGNFCISDFSIYAIRQSDVTKVDHQNAMFCYVTAGSERMAGIGCYGFITAQMWAERLGLNTSEEWWTCSESDTNGNVKSYIQCGNEHHEIPNLSLSESWVGILPTTFAAFNAWLKEVDDGDAFDAWFSKLNNHLL